MLMGLEDLIGQSYRFGGSDLPLSSSLVKGKRSSHAWCQTELVVIQMEWFRWVVYPVLNGQGIQIGKGISGGGPPTV